MPGTEVEVGEGGEAFVQSQIYDLDNEMRADQPVASTVPWYISRRASGTAAAERITWIRTFLAS